MSGPVTIPGGVPAPRAARLPLDGGDARTVVTAGPAATRSLAARLAASAQPGDILALDGPLGAGKTEFARGFARGLGVAGRVSSPSFVLMAEHEGRLPLFHLDGYRLAGPEDAWASGLLDERRADGVTVVEWATRFGSALPAGRLAIAIDGAGDEPRTITLLGTDQRHCRLLVEALGPASGDPGGGRPASGDRAAGRRRAGRPRSGPR